MRSCTHFIIITLLYLNSFSEARAEQFKAPAKPIANLLLSSAPPTPKVHANSGWIALLYYESLISQTRLNAPRLGLAGMRIEPNSRIVGTRPMITHIELINASPGKQQKQIWSATGANRFEYVEFSPNGLKLFAVKTAAGQASELWVYDILAQKAFSVASNINPAWGNPCSWADNGSVICLTTVAKPKTAVERPSGPIIVEHSGSAQPIRTYSLLLESAQDDKQFEALFGSALSLITLNGQRKILPIDPGIITHFSLSPENHYVSLRRIGQPFSRLAKAKDFPTRVEVWSLAEAKRVYQSAASGYAVEEEEHLENPKSLAWHPKVPETAGFLYREETADGVAYQWRTVSGPEKKASIIARHPHSITSFGWTNQGTPLYIAKAEDGQSEAVYAIKNNVPHELWRGRMDNPYQNPGKPILSRGVDGPILEHKNHIFVAGTGLNDQGPHPYLYSVDLNTGKHSLIYQNQGSSYERILALLDPGKGAFISAVETETQAMKLVSRNASQSHIIFQSKDPYPQLKNVSRELLSYRRNDSLALNAILYRPSAHRKPLPTLVWVYPREFDDPQLAEQLDVKPFRFHTILGPSPISAVLAGYAVVVYPSMPIVHDEQYGQDAYLKQLVSNAEALVGHLVSEGISDGKRIAIGGRSYGAFSSTNLLVHTDLFASGIAMSGAYNRTLTPFGFQHEKRSFWEATEYYTSISPFFFANKINEPLLLVHGGADPNPGTPKLQARRLFHALVGEGKQARYVELPDEEHVYRGEQTTLHAAWEMIHWLDKTLGPSQAPVAEPSDL